MITRGLAVVLVGAVTWLATPAGATEATPATYSFVNEYRQPPVLQQADNFSCVGYAFATAMAALAEVQTGRNERFNGWSIYAPIALPGGMAYPQDAVTELEQRGAFDNHGDGWAVTSAEWINTNDVTAVKSALAANKVLVVSMDETDTVVTDASLGAVVRYQPLTDRVVEAHELVMMGYGPHRWWAQNSWGTSPAKHGIYRFTWNYWRHYTISAVALTIKRTWKHPTL